MAIFDKFTLMSSALGIMRTFQNTNVYKFISIFIKVFFFNNTYSNIGKLPVFKISPLLLFGQLIIT